METISLGTSSLKTSRLAYGCWRIAGAWDPNEVTPEKAAAGRLAIIAALESGYTLFDHADIYCRGYAEILFGQVLKEFRTVRGKILIATKCGVRFPGEPWSDSPQRYDFSAEHIIESCEGSLKRLGVESIDLFQLHRPDFLANPEEIAEAFDKLMRAGKVCEFGVSNFRPALLTAVQKACPMKLISHQLEISLARMDVFSDGTLDQCLAEKMAPLAWSPLGGGVLGSQEKVSSADSRHHVSLSVQETVQKIAEARGVSRSVIALAWLLKHPSKIIPLVGSTDPERIRDAVAATEIELTRDEWYRLLIAARGDKLP
ncbi:MAG: aldo/keto reductase [Verrucomicrobiota bacterium]|nr:aldo/keto reductase [Verrucomicrobiota bacterium]